MNTRSRFSIAMLRSATLCSATLCSATLCSAMLLSVMLLACTDEPAPPSDTLPTPDVSNVASRTPSPSSPREQRTTTGPARVPCIVTAVSDGDSFRCRDIERVRLLLLDAPEMDQAPFGVMSRDALRARLPRGETVWLEFDVQREDRYGRTLAHAWTARTGGEHLNLAHARDGWAVAVVFPPNVRHIEAVREAVADARRGKRGLWRDGRFTCEPVAHKQGKC